VLLLPDHAHVANRGEEAATPAGSHHQAQTQVTDDVTARLRQFLKGFQGDWRGDTDESRGVPPPPVELPHDPGAPAIDLPPPVGLQLGTMPVSSAIAARRTRREFSSAPLTLEELSYLLWATQGVQKIVRNDEGRIVEQYRTVPSGGARHPFETYLGLSRVENVPPGLYRYVAFGHRLVRVWPSDSIPRQFMDACYGQEVAGQAAAVFVWAAVPYRTEWRYAYLSPRIVAVEAGHVCQNLYLSAESIGAGACAILAYDQARMDELIGADGKDTFTVYLACVGKLSSPREPHRPAVTVNRRSRSFSMEALQADARRCRACADAPCSEETPTQTDIPAMLEAFAGGDIAAAYATIRRSNVLPELCSHVTPAWHSGETACNAKGLPGEPVRIRDIQYAICWYAREDGLLPLTVPKTATGSSAAIVGGGPAGIACAARLLEMGHGVTIHEREQQLGGTPQQLIPRRRLPDTSPEIDAVLSPAIEAERLDLVFDSELGRNLQLEDLQSCHDAVVLATGLWRERSLGEAPGVVDGVRFLRESGCGEIRSVHGRVAVLAGGDCAMDAAVTAHELGADDIYVIYGGTRADLLWHKDERWFASEGVHCLVLTEPIGYEVDAHGLLAGLRVRRMEATGGGGYAPVPCSECVLDVDLVIEAMGLEPAPPLPDVLADAEGFIAVGGLVNGGASVAQCIAEGMQAAVLVGEMLGEK